MRRVKNQIREIHTENGEVLSAPTDIGQFVSAHFDEFHKKDGKVKETDILYNIPGCISLEDNLFLTDTPSKDEVKSSVFDLDPDSVQDLKGAKHVMRFFDLYQQYSGQIISMEKSKVFSGKIPTKRKSHLKEVINIPECKFPTQYLRVEIFKGRVKRDLSMPLANKFKGRLVGWKGKLLSLMERWTRNFIWSGELDTTKAITVRWDMVYKPQAEGGLGIRRLRDVNLAMLFKLTWFIKNDKSLIAAFLRKRFLSPSGKPKSSYICSSIWLGIKKVWDFVKQNERWVVGKGDSISFWFDRWLANYSVAEKVGINDNEMLHAKVSDFIVQGRWVLPTLSS
ncbi:uncharacterized protein LOC122092879 [Macadamia integrifolia]|uniref:uncharacterized protein LOC122092879 n=1 Tax=Macadamia integrifolia TaxID=60698 RepID=UPI001C52FB7B|nr:uncharacterized protein LOC122092879 [Macadamia integrifolia]